MSELTTDQKYDALCAFIQRHDSIHMFLYQCSDKGCTLDNFALSDNEFHRCGNRACIAGHLALLPEFRAEGGKISLVSGGPFYDKELAHDATAVAQFFNNHLHNRFFNMLIYGTRIKNWSDWTAKEAVQALRITQQCKGDFYQYVKDLNAYE